MKEEDLPVTQGLVGFVDILGFSSFLANNSAKYAAQMVLRVLRMLRHRLPEIASRFSGKRHTPTARFMDISTLVVSDSLIVTRPLPDGVAPADTAEAWFDFLLYITTLYRFLFDTGLPARGAITRGEFIVIESCFAGQPIVEAYRLGSSLALAAVAIHPDQVPEVMGAFESASVGSQHAVHEFLTPLTDRSMRTLTLLSPTPCLLPFIGDIRELIGQSFMAHKKQLPCHALEKLTNTETFFRYAKTLHPDAFVTPTSAMTCPMKRARHSKPR